MAILNSRALQEQNELLELQRKEADECYRIIEGWQSRDNNYRLQRQPVWRKPVIEDITPFRYNNKSRPVKNTNPQQRWSEL